MTVRKSLHIGLNAFDPGSYGNSGTLVACENDARDMRRVAENLGYEPAVLLTAGATCAAVVQAIGDAADALAAGDHFLLTYSGHGGQVPAVDDEEVDRLDETWCLYDTQLRDNDIHHALAGFAPGAQVLLLSDSCHSGTVTRDAALARDQQLEDVAEELSKRAPVDVTFAEFDRHRDQYAARATGSAGQVRATGALISGCRDDQVSMDGDQNGAFTAAFLACWNDGMFVGNLNELHAGIKSRLVAGGYVQDPQLFPVGPQDDAYFDLLNTRPVPW